MKPEDKSHVEAIRDGSQYGAVGFLIRIIDEQAAEIAKPHTPTEEHCGTRFGGSSDCIHAFNGVLDSCDCTCASCIIGELHYERDAAREQLAEERSKRETAEKSRDDWRNQWSGLLMHEDAAKRLSESSKLRADKAERELAEERERGAREDMARLAMRDRAEKAEASVAELEAKAQQDQRSAVIAWFDENKDAAVKQMGDLNGVLENELTEAQARVAELQALVDAATRFEWPPFTVWKTCDTWLFTDERDEPWSDQHRSQPSRDEAITLARDLAAKEKDPTT